MKTDKDKLKACPTCGSTAGVLGLRDYSTWLFNSLPGNAAGTDFDCVVEHKGKFLMFEFKPSKYVPKGQALTFDSLVKNGWDVYVVVDKDESVDALLVARWTKSYPLSWHPMTRQGLQNLARSWWDDIDVPHPS